MYFFLTNYYLACYTSCDWAVVGVPQWAIMNKTLANTYITLAFSMSKQWWMKNVLVNNSQLDAQVNRFNKQNTDECPQKHNMIIASLASIQI